MRTNPKTNLYSGYYRLVESYRNCDNRVCHRTILNAGYLDELNTDQLNLIELGICRIVKKVVILGNQILYYGAKV